MSTNPPARESLALPIRGRAAAMVLARESAMYNSLLLQGMIDQTLATCPLPGADTVRGLGLRPIQDPASCDLAIYQEARGKARGTVFSHEQVVYLYSEGSAASTSEETGDNDFIEMLIDLIEEYRPGELYVATFSRLVRSALFSGRLLQTLQRHCPVVNCGGLVIDLGTKEGVLMWQTMSLVSSTERDFIVQRLFAGMVSKYRRGEWLLGRRAVPYGYELVDKRLRPVPDLQPTIEQMLTVLADDARSAHVRIRALGELGLQALSPRHRGRVDHLRDPGRKLTSLYRWHELWTTGSFTLRVKNPFPGARSFGDLPVHYDDNDTGGRILFRQEPGVPEGGWANDSTLAAFTAAARRRLDGRSAPAERDRHWLTGFINETQGDVHLCLIPSHRNYQLRSTPRAAR